MRRIKQPDKNPYIRTLVQVADKEASVVSGYHLIFEALPKWPLPIVAVLPPPLPISLPSVPIGARHGVPLASRIAAPIFVLKSNRIFSRGVSGKS
jgi:hypothetical protein